MKTPIKSPYTKLSKVKYDKNGIFGWEKRLNLPRSQLLIVITVTCVIIVTWTKPKPHEFFYPPCVWNDLDSTPSRSRAPLTIATPDEILLYKRDLSIQRLWCIRNSFILIVRIGPWTRREDICIRNICKLAKRISKISSNRPSRLVYDNKPILLLH